jgi:carboxypeptidase Q
VYVSYGVSVSYRDYGAYEASKVGGLASLIRSIAPFSINSPHTGWQDYKNGTAKIPTACITIEDAEMLSRMAARGERIVVHLYMEGHSLPRATSRNTVAEIVGTKYPEQV